MAQLNNCRHCGAEAEFIVDAKTHPESVLARCTSCKIQTQPVVSSLEYSARDKVAGVWNASLDTEWPDWIQPKGAHDAYSYGSKVSHGGKHWIGNVAANVWEPGVSGWTEQKGGAA